MIHLKSKSQVALLKHSADLVSRTLAEVGKYVKVGVTTGELDAIAEDFILRHNAKPAFKGYRVGSQVFPASLCISTNDEVVHGIPGDRKLVDGDLVSVDCGVLLNGYYGDSAYTFGVGKLDPKDVKLLCATYEALEAGIERARVGFRIGDISYAIQQRCQADGYGIVRDLVGHGIGKSLHEDPQVPNFGKRGTGRKLKAGLAICIEPMVNRGVDDVVFGADGWTVSTADQAPSAHYEKTVVVYKGAAEVLTSFEPIEDVINAPYKLELEHGKTTSH